MPTPSVHFVIAAPFSGGRRLMAILNRHPAIFASEHQLFGAYFDARPATPNARSPRITFDRYARSFANHYQFRSLNFERRDFVNQFVDEFAEFAYQFSAKHSGKSEIVDVLIPFPGSSRKAIASVLKRFPEAKIVNLVRDGRDVATAATLDSIPFDGYGTDRHAYFVENRPGAALNRFFDDQALQTWANHWSETVEMQLSTDERIIQIRYEDLKSSPREHLDQIAEHFQLPSTFVDENLNFSQEGMRERVTLKAPNQKNEEPPFEHWYDLFTQKDGRLFNELAGDCLQQLGFVTNDDWIEQLPNTLELVAKPH